MGLLIPFLQLCVHLLALPVYVLALFGCWDSICKKTFPYFMSRISKSYNQKLHKEKERLFGSLGSFAGRSGHLSLLEIGAGSGANFSFYPPGCRVTCTDPNPNFQQYLLRAVTENRHLRFEGFVVAAAEDLRPVPDASVDVVVSTLVLCSVADVGAVLKEVLRVLRPGGAFYFMEHVAAQPSSWKYFWQQVFNPTWKFVADGCCLLKETWKDLGQASFSELHLRHINAPLKWTLVRPHILGHAVK